MLSQVPNQKTLKKLLSTISEIIIFFLLNKKNAGKIGVKYFPNLKGQYIPNIWQE